MQGAWVHDLARQCRSANVPYFVKQLGAAFVDEAEKMAGRLLHRAGADMEEWPEDLRVREFPNMRIRRW